MSMDSEDDARATALSLEKQQAKTRVKSPSKKKHRIAIEARHTRVKRGRQKRVRLDTAVSTGAQTSSGRQMFPDGELLRVDTMHATKVETPSIRLGGVLCPCDELAFTILSTFIALNAIQSGAEECIPELGARVAPLTGGGGGRGCMHMKYMLLFAKSGALHIVIGSANLVLHEWRHIENDFLRTNPGVETVKLRAREKSSEAFQAVLVAALRATGVEEALAIMILQGHTAPLPTLVPSADIAKAGTKSSAGTGQTRFLRAVQALGCSVDDWRSESKGKAGPRGMRESQEQRQEQGERGGTSSIATYSVPWIAVFHLCAGGRAQALRAYLHRGQKRIPAQGPTRVIYPTLETIRGTVLGEAGASSISCGRAQWVKIAVLVADPTTGLQMRDAKGRSGGVGMHTKMILGTLRCASAQDDDTKNETESEGESDAAGKPLRRSHAWFCVGSHNFSVSAWGALSGSGFNPVLNIVTYELGIVLRLERPEDVDAAVAWERPARKLYRGGRTVDPAGQRFFQVDAHSAYCGGFLDGIRPSEKSGGDKKACLL
ncbi:hypothetical protein B0H13DRAFT_2569095 [Mycena leptocephala]|nr:hypothetical protein B0H13DRAFT_2569095 [Mycena leptocephala]